MVCLLPHYKKFVTVTGEVDNFIVVEMNACLHRANISCANLKTN